MAATRIALVACLAAACGKGGTQRAPAREDGGTAKPIPARVDLAPRPLGLAEIAGYEWRKRAGAPAFKAARIAEGKGDWAAAAAACREALAADPTHLDASWLLAASLGELHQIVDIIEPLRAAVAGDFQKWGGDPVLSLPQLAEFFVTPTGEAFKRRIEEDRTAYLEALARSTIVEGDGDLYAFDPRTTRWHRLTRTGGAVVGVLAAPGGKQLAYVQRQGKKGKRELAIGVVDLSTGRTSKAEPIGAIGATIAYSAKAPAGFYVGTGKTWHVFSPGKLEPLPPKTARPPGRRLEVQNKTARLQALPVPTVTADWDDQGLAGAMRIGSSNKVVTVPSPGLIDGNTVTWSPDHTRIAFIAQLQPDAVCTPGMPRAAAYTADASTGAATLLYTPVIPAQKIDRGLSVEWTSERTLLVASATGVTTLSLDGSAPAPLVGATDLVTPRPRPRCTPAPDDDTPDDPEAPETAGAGGGGTGPTMVGPP